jgi:uncharacterized glyoxalase superfamily protein PhnB
VERVDQLVAARGERLERHLKIEALTGEAHADAVPERDRDRVDAVLEEARAAGASYVETPQEREWGGYTGYFADPAGYRWEVAWNPGDIGRLVLPDPKETR